MITRLCRHCDHEYRVFTLDDSGLCPRCESEALGNMRMPSAKEAVGVILILAALVVALLVVSLHKDWG